MDFMLHIPITSPEQRITYNDKIFVIGSCFSEHIGGRLSDLKFPVLQNPNGILFDPLSISKSLLSYIEGKQYKTDEFFHFNELWLSWRHHSSFSGLDKQEVVDKINNSQKAAHEFLRTCEWLIITPGTSFSYQLLESGEPVANCHRVPAQRFRKHLLAIEEIVACFDVCIQRLVSFNPKIKIVFTISPVRHIRDGVVANNRSKARLIEAVHELVSKHQQVSYFPAYELVIDILRDYRFYDIDMVHPNYAATEFVFKKFADTFIDGSARETMEEIKNIVTAYNHKPFQPLTVAHQEFLKAHLNKIQHFQQKNPHLDFKKELAYFSRSGDHRDYPDTRS